MTSSSSHTIKTWIAEGSTSIVPPADYWADLAGLVPDHQIQELQQQSDQRLNEFTPDGLPPPESSAVELLNHVAADGWLEPNLRQKCPNCAFVLNEKEASQPACPNCRESYTEHGGVVTETVYVRHLAPSRGVDWVVAIHGMTTTGAWQEAFNWHLGTTWGQSVPVAVYKYGFITAGVIMAWRRRKLQRGLRHKLAVLRDEATARGFLGRPDVIAHSFGTWLLGHLLEDELARTPEDQIRCGRIILTGCILRPDFDWKRLKDAGLVEDVLNHYGSKDPIVPLAHVTIWDSGPSGRRGFDGDQLLNIRAEGYGHSDLFSIQKCVVNCEHLHDCKDDAGEIRHLEHSYKRYWRPFLTLPRNELCRLPDRADPTTTWRQLPWPLRGTVFPFVALPFILALMAFLVAAIGSGLWEVWEVPATVAGISAAGLVLMLAAIAKTGFWRRLCT